MRIDVVTLFPEMVDHAARFGVTGRALERGLWQLGDVESARFRDGQLPDRRRPAVRRRAGNGDAGGAAGEGAGGGAGGAAGGRVRGDADDLPVAGGRAADAPAGRGARGGGGYDGVRAASRGGTRAIDERLRRARGRRGNRDRRFRRLGRRAAGADADRCGRAAASGRAERRGVGGAGLVRRRAARLSALHAARAVAEASGERVPEVLLSGHHEAIRAWRLKQALGRTWERRPDLLGGARAVAGRTALLAAYRREQAQQQ